jgi:Flp pilus assembly protein TadD
MTAQRTRLVYLVLFLLTAGVFCQVARCGFLNFDDWTYVSANGPVRAGITSAGLSWAFHTMHSYNWHPLTWLSHMLDCQMFGLNPAAHHLVNLGFHLANTLLLFHVLRRLTRDFWPCALTAAFFALHPLHVESVAWISERKDVLSTLFWLLTIWSYTRYAQKVVPATTGAPADSARFPAGDYGLALLFFALGLMSKPMLVTLPFVLLLLDIWPLERLPGLVRSTDHIGPAVKLQIPWRATAGLLIEKIPFLVLSVVSCVLTLRAQSQGGAIIGTARIDIADRLCNAVVAYARYLGKTFWPNHLAVFYPYRLQWPDEAVIGAVLLLAAITIVSLKNLRRRPWLGVGWFWFLGTLVPVIGLVQAGGQSMADRYMYVPSIGLFVMVFWGAKEFVMQSPQRQAVCGTAAALALAGCAAATTIQLSYWHDSEALMRHCVAVTEANPMAEYLLGDALAHDGKPDEALVHLDRSSKLNPTYAPTQGKIADILIAQGRIGEAIFHYRAFVELQPDNPAVLNNLAWMLACAPEAELRNGPEAVDLARRACNLTQERSAMCLGTLAAAYAESGRFDEAVRTAEQACAIATAAGQKEIAAQNARLLDLYRSGRPCHQLVPQQ